MFAVVVPKQDVETLLPIIMRFITPGSIIHSDCWKAYKDIPELEDYHYQHGTVNHSMEFKSASGVHTNMIEGAWSAQFKRHIPKNKYNKHALPQSLFKCMWLQRYHNNLWDAFWHDRLHRLVRGGWLACPKKFET